MNSVNLLQKLLSFRSITPFDDGCLDFISTLLKQIGFTCSIIEFSDSDSISVKNLYARLGKKGNNFCFAGHVDVVPTGNLDLWSADPFAGKIINEAIYGRGAVDMKGGIAAFISAVSNSNIRDDQSISLLLTADEEGLAINGIKKMIPWLQSHNEKIDMCIIGEPTSNVLVGDTIKIGARGSITISIEVIGKQGHVAYHDVAINPIHILTDIISELKSTIFDSGNAFFQSSNLEFTDIHVGNDIENLIPGNAVARCNIRFGNMHTSSNLAKVINDICLKHTKDFRLKWHSSGDAFLTDHKIIAPLVADAIRDVIGIDSKINTFGGTSDARFLTHYCPVVEIGLLNNTAHQINENVSINDLNTLINIYEAVLKKCGMLR